MNSSSPTSAKIVSNAASGTWSYVFEFRVDDIFVYIVVAKEQSDALSPEAVWNGQNPTFAQLKEKVALFERQFQKSQILRTIRDFVDTTKDNFALLSGSFELAVVAISENTLHMASYGAVSALLLRDGQLVQLTQGSQKTTTITGSLKVHDMLCVATSAFVRVFPQGVLKATLSHSHLDTIVENLAPQVMSYNNPFISSVFITIPGESSTTDMPQPVESTPQAEAPYMPKTGVKHMLVSLIDRLLNALPQKRLYVNPLERSQEARSRKKIPMVIGIALLAVLSGSVFFGIQRQSRLNLEKDFSKRMSEATSRLEEAKTLKGINQPRARDLLLEAKVIVDELESHEGKSADYELVAQSISENLGEIGGIYMESPSLYLDLALVSSGFVGEKIAVSEGRMLVLDTARNKLVSIEIDSKKTQIVAGPSQLSDVIDIALYADRDFIVDSSGIKEIENEARQVVASDWGSQVHLLAFAGNLYLLNQDQNTITRYSGAGRGFSEGTPWINEGSVASFSDVKSFVVDGAFWILEGSNEVDKWNLGREEVFLLTGGSDESEFIDLYTDENLAELYLLDAKNSRIVVFDKRGNYSGEYQAKELADARDIIVSNQKIIFLSGSKLYSLDLKHHE